MANIFDEEPTVEIHKSPKDKVQGYSEDNGFASIRAIKELKDSEGFQLPTGLNFYTNELLKLASPILSILLSISRLEKPFDLKNFRVQLLDLLRDFKSRATSSEYHPSVVEKATYVLCVAIDEEIAHTSWGKAGGWMNHSLLSSMFTQRNGGEIFFVLLDKACQQPKLLIDFIELIYVLLMLGFKGKYSDTDQNELYEIKSYVYSLIEHYYVDSKHEFPKSEENIAKSKAFEGARFISYLFYLFVVIVLVVAVNQFIYLNSRDNVFIMMKDITKTSQEKFLNNSLKIKDSKIEYKLLDPNKPKDKSKTDASNQNKENTKNKK